MRAHIANAVYGVLDYAAYPIGMLLAAPVLLHALGIARYGVWTVAAAAISMGSIIAAGFGDANIQRVATLRGQGRHNALLSTVRCMIAINLVLGTILASLTWFVTPLLARHVTSADLLLQRDCIWSLRLATILLWLRTMESVCISTQRAFERYGAAVRISILARLLSLAASAFLACIVHSVAGMMAAAAVLNLAGTVFQYVRLREVLQAPFLLPAFDHDAFRALLRFGVFSWLQAVSVVIFSQADRLVLGASLGAAALTSYALCTQMAQPIYGVAAAGLHFLFPHLAERRASHASPELSRVVGKAFAWNLLFVAIATATLLSLGPWILTTWGGEVVRAASASIFPVVVCSSALFALSVTATYTLFALGRVRVVTSIYLAGGGVMAVLMMCLVPRFGGFGLALSRLTFGAITLLLYPSLQRHLAHPSCAAKPAWEKA
jgi:O-antigen/teichoic acid export membrane protein